jgi:lipopolysaccharide transport system ATP-binding protein
MKLKNFSSGMTVRLAFATAIQTDPDILLVDEVLSVGDEAFQKKSSNKIGEIRRSGKTIIVVSHALGMVRDLCNRCMLIKNGTVTAVGKTDDVIEQYVATLKT